MKGYLLSAGCVPFRTGSQQGSWQLREVLAPASQAAGSKAWRSDPTHGEHTVASDSWGWTQITDPWGDGRLTKWVGTRAPPTSS